MISLEQASSHLEQDLGFNAGNLTAFSNGSDYLVFSYSTLIASRKGGEVWLTPIRYSVTTSKHLNIVKRAWGLL